MSVHSVGYVWVSTKEQELTAQRNRLATLSVLEDRIYTDYGLTGTNSSPNSTASPAPFPMPATSSTNPRTTKVKLSISESIHALASRLLFNVLAMVAELESGHMSALTREGLQFAKDRGLPRGKQPKPSKAQEAHLVTLYRGGQHTTDEIDEVFEVARSTVYRIVNRTLDKQGEAQTRDKGSDGISGATA